jgi:hypothetical protein
MGKEERSLIEKLEYIDRRVLFWILTIIMIIMMVRPVGLPVLVSDHTKAFYNALEKLRPGDVVLIDLGITFATIPELSPSFTVTIHKLCEIGARLIFVGYSDVQPAIYEMLAVPIFKEYPGKKYGVDYVNLGFIPGGETGVKALADNIPGIAKTDSYGTSIEKIPLMSGVKDASDVNLIITFEGGAETIWHIRHWHMRYGTPIIASGTGAIVSDLLPYRHAGTLMGLSGGIRGGAELEILAKRPGAAAARMDVISASHLYLLLLIVVCNVLFLYRRFESQGWRR